MRSETVGQWQNVSGGGAFAVESQPQPYGFTAGGPPPGTAASFVFYVSATSRMSVLFWNNNSNTWTRSDMNSLTGAPTPACCGSPIVSIFQP
jgi:hypothetical protein